MNGRLSAIIFSFWVVTPLHLATGQDDGACVVELSLATDVVSRLQDILSETASGFGPSDHAIAAPFTTRSPVADGAITAGEYPNTCHYSFADDDNPGKPFPGLEFVDDDNDLSLDLHLAHTDQFVFFGFEATDEFIDMDETQSAWNNDGVELNINPDLEIFDGDSDTLEAFKVTGDVTGDGDVELNNRIGRKGILEGISAGPPDDDQFVSAGKPSDTGWVLEFQLPLAALDVGDDFGDTIEPAKTGDVMLINFAVNDIDVDGGDQNVGTHGMLWVVEDDPRSPQGGREEVWVTPLQLTGPVDRGDIDGDGDRDADDIDALSAAVKNGDTEAAFDVNLDGVVNDGDRGHWVGVLQNTYFGDANLDGQFNSGDLVAVFTAGEYEDGVAINSGWAEGDWNGDMEFDSGDLVVAFREGGYQKGPKPGARAVPEPTSTALMLAGLATLIIRRRRRDGSRRIYDGT